MCSSKPALSWETKSHRDHLHFKVYSIPFAQVTVSVVPSKLGHQTLVSTVVVTAYQLVIKIISEDCKTCSSESNVLLRYYYLYILNHTTHTAIVQHIRQNHFCTQYFVSLADDCILSRREQKTPFITSRHTIGEGSHKFLHLVNTGK